MDNKSLSDEFVNQFAVYTMGDAKFTFELMDKIEDYWLKVIDQVREETINKSTDIVAKYLYENNYDLCIGINKELQALIIKDTPNEPQDESLADNSK